jgi:hypothetical protein
MKKHSALIRVALINYVNHLSKWNIMIFVPSDKANLEQMRMRIERINENQRHLIAVLPCTRRLRSSERVFCHDPHVAQDIS